MSKEAYYFSHDSNARHDPKILAMRSEYGMFGYGVYWMIIEMLREQEDFCLPSKNYIWNAIAMQVQSNDFTKDDAKQFVEDCINEFDLLASDGEYFWSNSLVKRMDRKNSISEKRRQAAKKRWQKSNNDKGSGELENSKNNNAEQNDANAEQDYAIKGKEKKGNESKGNIEDEERAREDPFTIYEQNFGILKPILRESFIAWCEDVGDDIMIAAMRLAAQKGGRSFEYIEKILREWSDHNLKTLDQVRSYEREKTKPGGKAIPFQPKQKQSEAKAILDRYRRNEA